MTGHRDAQIYGEAASVLAARFNLRGVEYVGGRQHYRVVDSDCLWEGLQRVNFYWDSKPLDQYFSQYAWGRLAAVDWQDGQFSEMYSYTLAGAVTRQRLRYGAGNLEADYTYDNEGKMASVQYPLNGPLFTYTYDEMGRSIRTPRAAPRGPSHRKAPRAVTQLRRTAAAAARPSGHQIFPNNTPHGGIIRFSSAKIFFLFSKIVLDAT